jgi:hypothetical protein
MLLLLTKQHYKKLYNSSRRRFWRSQFLVPYVDSPTGDCCARDGVVSEGVPMGECWPSGDSEYYSLRGDIGPWGGSGPIVVVLPANNKNIKKLIYMDIKCVALGK